ncbi:MAG: GNAT family N-acetyltransferase [Clostridia bacterium]|nr:GNAT family N-acetyltransferase [Clostridia bacterium]
MSKIKPIKKPMKIRFAKKSELEEVNALRKQVHKLHANGRPDIFRQKFGKKLAQHIYDFFGAEHSKVVVAKRGGVICGFASIEIIQKPRSPYNKARKYLRVTEFGVDKAHRRQGTGRALMEFIKQYAAEKGVDTVELDVWEFNRVALRFYEDMGFRTYRRFMEIKL